MPSLDFMPYVFAAITLISVGYFLISIIFGGLADMDVDVDLGGVDVPEDGGKFGCQIISVFMAVFGAIGLAGSLSGWDLLLTLVVAAIAGAIMGRLVLMVLKFVVRQQSASISGDTDLIGASARITIDIPAGKTGEAFIDGQFVGKYPTRSVDGTALSRGDTVEVVDMRQGTLYVKRKNMG